MKGKDLAKMVKPKRLTPPKLQLDRKLEVGDVEEVEEVKVKKKKRRRESPFNEFLDF